MSNTATFFDGLPFDALCVIVTQANELLRKNGYVWPSNSSDVDANESERHTRSVCCSIEFLLLLFSENSPFRAAAATLVSQIKV